MFCLEGCRKFYKLYLHLPILHFPKKFAAPQIQYTKLFPLSRLISPMERFDNLLNVFAILACSIY